MSDNDEHTEKRLRGMILSGAEILGGAAAGAVGFFAAGPAGAAALGGIGAAAAAALRHAGQEAAQRLLGPREQVRIGAMLALTASRIKEKAEQGHQFRNDGFFDEKEPGRSDAEDIAESLIGKAQREAEEMKLPFMANMLANIAFDSLISPQMAHQLSKIAESLTYRQLAILRTIPHAANLGLRGTNYHSHGSFSKELYQVLYEVFDLERRGFIAVGGNAVLGITDIIPRMLKIQGVGTDLYNLMGLSTMKASEVAEIVRVLSIGSTEK
jgi:hypothetical protein